MQRFIPARLSLMMFLQFFVRGTWSVTLVNYMAANGMADLVYWPGAADAVGAVVSPFLLGLVADRFFATEKVLAAMHLLGAVILLALPLTVGSPAAFCSLVLIYCLCFMATMGLVNSMTFHNIKRQETQFPIIRVFGTFGWMAAGLLIGWVLGQFAVGQLVNTTPLPLYLAGFASLVFGLYSLTLPHTPPRGAGLKVSVRTIVGIDAFKQLASKSFYVFVACLTLLYIPLGWYEFAPVFVTAAVYDVGTSNFMTAIFPNPSSLMSMGQMSEIVFMLLMPLFFVKLGVKWMLAAGMAAWVLRYALFAIGAPGAVFWTVAAGILLHGICYDFLFVTASIYMDKKASPEIRGQAQGFIVLITYGIGRLVGAALTGLLFNRLLAGEQTNLSLADWQSFWWVPAILAGIILVLFVILFDEKTEPRGNQEARKPETVAAAGT